ncbi:sugar ABC transporter ATP-binding protein [Candidatus Aerophobetes bacterium]|uniref:Sugar ABC transporter ATP-binding protein n=1 Tax=Aerophobetes bacterium TaxID=2030807 RepID=A0A662DH99_UNCAE|nr:MAG: sugar ABC transporter ATP-binding protein [Candidatus Aerophobetes bacterium]
MSAVQIKGVVKRFFPQASLFAGKGEAIVALDHIHLNVKEGEIFCIIGPSGCGKTTLLRVIAGLEQADEGDIYIDGKKVNNVSPKDRKIGMVFQNLALYPHMNVRKNLTFSLKMRGFSEEVIRERMELACRILGKEFRYLLDRKPRTLSEGQKRRVALGRCIVQDARLFLMDEPLANLDPRSSMQIRVEMMRLLTSIGRTTIYVTHDQYEVPSVAKRVGVMREGRLEQIGTFEEVYNHPVNRFVATFLGDPPMNLLRLVLKEDKSGLYLIDPPFRIDLPKENFGILKEKGYLWEEIIMGIRPEHIKLGDKDGTSPLVCKFKGRVEATGINLSQLLVYLTVGSQTLIAALDPFLKLKTGEMLPLNFSLDKTVFFDPITGNAVL